MKGSFVFVLLVGLTAGCVHSVQNVERIPHISALRLAGSNSVTFESVETAWHLISDSPAAAVPANSNGVTRLTLRPGDSFLLTEGHHVSVVLKLVRVTGGQIIVDEATTHRPPNEPRSTTVVRRIKVSPYLPDTAATSKSLSQEEIGYWVNHINDLKRADVHTLTRALVCDQTYLRAMAAKQLGQSGDAASIRYLIIALGDDSIHDGVEYAAAGMETTRYWANASLKALTKQDFGFRWDASKAERNAAIRRWKKWFNKQEFADLIRLVAKSKQP
jgi:hypothetical protein